LSCSVAASPQDLQKSCRDFVQGFYDWYVPKALKVNVRPADLVLKYKSSAFSPELLRALREDSEAQARSPEKLVSLDFDPFLNTQDPSQRYVVGSITLKGDRYWAEVYSVTLGRKSAMPAVVAELTLKNGQWMFVNFHYGKSERSADENLVSTLKALRRHAPGQ
jgi:hypothetical protein